MDHIPESAAFRSQQISRDSRPGPPSPGDHSPLGTLSRSLLPSAISACLPSQSCPPSSSSSSPCPSTPLSAIPRLQHSPLVLRSFASLRRSSGRVRLLVNRQYTAASTTTKYAPNSGIEDMSAGRASFKRRVQSRWHGEFLSIFTFRDETETCHSSIQRHTRRVVEDKNNGQEWMETSGMCFSAFSNS